MWRCQLRLGPALPTPGGQLGPQHTPPGHTMTVVTGVSVLGMALLFSLVPPEQPAFHAASTQGDLSQPCGLRALPACPELDDHRHPRDSSGGAFIRHLWPRGAVGRKGAAREGAVGGWLTAEPLAWLPSWGGAPCSSTPVIRPGLGSVSGHFSA